jgi:beta-galactosidase
MKEEGEVINWFEITAPDGYLSINNTIGDIMSTFGGKIVMFKFVMMLKNAMSGGKGKDGEEKKGGGGVIGGFKVTPAMLKNIYGMAKGFTIKRACSMLGGALSKDQILEINKKLNKVKAPKK